MGTPTPSTHSFRASSPKSPPIPSPQSRNDFPEFHIPNDHHINIAGRRLGSLRQGTEHKCQTNSIRQRQQGLSQHISHPGCLPRYSMQPQLDAFEAPAELDQYGGLKGHKREATGFFRILGCRFSRQSPKEVVEVAGKYVDVVSFNSDNYEIPKELFDEFYRLTGKPFLIGEFGFGAPEGGAFSGGSFYALLHRKSDRAQCYRHYVETLAADFPYFVGAHWFKCYDSPPSGVPGKSGRHNFNLGLVDACDMPYDSLVVATRKTNQRVYPLALGRAKPLRGLPPFAAERERLLKRCFPNP